MTPEQFRRLAVSASGAEEHEHQHHPDFRIGGKIFATMGYPDETRAMLKLTPEQQAEFIHDHPNVFSPSAGKWGEKGCTSVALRKATKAIMQPAVEAARQNAMWAALAGEKRAKPASKTSAVKSARKKAQGSRSRRGLAE
jgi:hypothetical protein